MNSFLGRIYDITKGGAITVDENFNSFVKDAERKLGEFLIQIDNDNVDNEYDSAFFNQIINRNVLRWRAIISYVSSKINYDLHVILKKHFSHNTLGVIEIAEMESYTGISAKILSAYNSYYNKER